MSKRATTKTEGSNKRTKANVSTSCDKTDCIYDVHDKCSICCLALCEGCMLGHHCVPFVEAPAPLVEAPAKATGGLKVGGLSAFGFRKTTSIPSILPPPSPVTLLVPTGKGKKETVEKTIAACPVHDQARKRSVQVNQVKDIAFRRNVC